jgi:hypothetical protein
MPDVASTTETAVARMKANGKCLGDDICRSGVVHTQQQRQWTSNRRFTFLAT